MDEIEMLKEKCRALELALAAAHVETARAELRARDAVEALGSLYTFPGVVDLLAPRESLGSIRAMVEVVLAAAPDSDARLREMVADAAERVAVRERLLPIAQPYRRQAILAIVDEVLGAKS